VKYLVLKKLSQVASGWGNVSMQRDLRCWDAGNARLVHAELISQAWVGYLVLIAFLQSTWSQLLGDNIR